MASGTAAETFRRTCEATHTVSVHKPWVLLCRTTKTNGLTEAIVLGKAIRKIYWAEQNDAGEVDEGGRLWTFITEGEWEDECFLSPSQVYRALEKLEALGFVAQRKVQRRRGGHPVRHVTVFGDVIGAALEAMERGEWNPEPILRALTSSRGRDEVGREGATNFTEGAPRAREEVAEVGREGATDLSRGRDEASRNKEELPPVTTAEPPTTSVPVAASDAGTGPERGTDCRGRSLTPQQILWATIARAFDWDPLLRDPDQHKQVEACSTKLAKRQVTGNDIAEVADRAWWFLSETRGATPAMLGQRWGTIIPDATIVAHRHAAARVLTSATTDLSLGPAGRCERRQQAEREIATLLSAGEAEEAIGQALRSCRTWTVKALGYVLDQVDRGQRAIVGSERAPDDLTQVDGVLQLVTLLRRSLDVGEGSRVGAEIDRRLPGLNDRQRERLRVEFTKPGFSPLNDVPDVVDGFLRRLRPADPERDAANARDLAAWGGVPTKPEPLALPGGTTR